MKTKTILTLRASGASMVPSLWLGAFLSILVILSFISTLEAKDKEDEGEYVKKIIALEKDCPILPDKFKSSIHPADCSEYYRLKETALLLTYCPDEPANYDSKIHDIACDNGFKRLEVATEEERAAILTLKNSDQDGDRINDARDQCPVDPEDFNGVDDTDGCTDGGIRVTNNQICTAPVYFGFNRSRIDLNSAKSLCHLAGALYYHPGVKEVYVIGHADNISSAKLNQQISRTRARRVIKYLKECDLPAGIELIPLGAGKKYPVASNKTEEGRQENRRAIFARQKDDPSKQ